MVLHIIQKGKNFPPIKQSLVIYAFVFVVNGNAHQRNAHRILGIASLRYLKDNVVRPIMSAVRNTVFIFANRILNYIIFGLQIIPLMILGLVINLVNLTYFRIFLEMRQQEMKQIRNQSNNLIHLFPITVLQ